LKETAVADWKNKGKVMHRYNLTADMYEERYAEEQKAKYEVALENVEIANCNILDVGCGSGLFFSHAAKKVKVLVAVDVSHKLLLKAKEQAHVFENVFVLQADADHLPFRGAFCDAVFAFTLLQNMPEPSETLNQFKLVAKLGGKVVVTGLKKVFSVNTFMDVLEGAGLQIISFVDKEDLKCYVAVLAV
jgi:ubiquinone/menaquinone biosynthesis C-methylase UbiE